jgi:hypothetical protein
MREVALTDQQQQSEVSTFVACLATILEVPLGTVPEPPPGQGPATGWLMSRWLGGMGLGLAALADPASFSWAGPWLARVQPAGEEDRRWVVMYGVPSGVAWDPSGVTATAGWRIVEGFLIAPGDVALARPSVPSPRLGPTQQ